MNPATCSSCLHYCQKGSGTGLCVVLGGWESPHEEACERYLADSPEGV